MKKRIYLPKLVPLCPLMRSHALSRSYCQSPLFPITQFETSHLPFPSKLPSPRSLFGGTSSFSSRLRCHGHSLLLSSYLYRISRKENSACSACGHSLQDLNHLLLDCPATEPLRKSIFGSSLSILDLWSRPWGVARLLGLNSAPPSLGRGRGVPPPSRKLFSASIFAFFSRHFLALMAKPSRTEHLPKK